MRIRESVAATHKGNRGHNEDAVLRLPKVPVFAVADGMGGPGAGDIAAGIVLDIVKQRSELLNTANLKVGDDRSTNARLGLGRVFDDLFNASSREVQRESTRLQRPGMGSTLCVATIVRNYAYVAHVGDSRAYLWREGRLTKLTEDHTIAELHLRRGKITREEYEQSPDRRVLYQVLGAGIEVDSDLAEVRLAGGDLLLLTSDGIPRAIHDDLISTSIKPDDLKGTLQRIFEAALAAGAPDNLAAVLLALESEVGDEPIEAVLDVMRDVFLFKDMTQPELLTVAPYLEEIVYDTGATIVTEGEVAQGLYIVVSGAVRMTRGKTTLLDVRPGGYFGELALARQPAKLATVRAMSATRVFVLTRDRFHELLRQKPELGARVAVALLEAVGERLRDMTDRISAVERAVRGELRG